MQTVRTVQTAQKSILRDVKEVCSEGLTEVDYPIFQALIRVLRKNASEEALLRIGAAGQLMVEGKLTVLP